MHFQKRRIDSEGDEIPPITTDHGVRHVGKVFANAMRAARLQEASDSTLPPVRANTLRSACKSRYDEGRCVVNHSPSVGDLEQYCESGTVRCETAQTLSVDSSSDDESR